MESSSLSYKVAPLITNDRGPHPTLVLLHGRGADENDLLSLTSQLDPHLLIVSVRAPSRFPYGGYTWFDLDETGAVNIDQLLNSCDKFFGFLDDFSQKYPVDSRRLFLFGFSMGAMISLTVSLSRPNHFKGIVAHSGLLLQHKRLSYRWDDLDDTSFFIAHGEHDPIVPVELGRQAHQQLVQANANVTYREYPIPHVISEESLSDAATWLKQHI
jgi:phospholipase/carboxylesterase